MGGICKLTGKSGKYVKSHILPKALTKLNNEGIPYLQYGIGSKPTKRWDSWYDMKLVTLDGEKILSEYDDEGIKILRKNGLIWSSPHFNNNLNDFDVRELTIENSSTLRLFFLSCLWRSCQTSIDDFKNVTMGKERLKILHNMILTKNPNPISFLPITLITISKPPELFNYIVTYEIKEIFNPDDNTTLTTIFYRIYFEGLIVHIQDEVEYPPYFSGKIILGGDTKLFVIHKKWETSYQKENMEQTIYELNKFYRN